jgi:hypothetical protein
MDSLLLAQKKSNDRGRSINVHAPNCDVARLAVPLICVTVARRTLAHVVTRCVCANALRSSRQPHKCLHWKKGEITVQKEKAMLTAVEQRYAQGEKGAVNIRLSACLSRSHTSVVVGHVCHPEIGL